MRKFANAFGSDKMLEIPSFFVLFDVSFQRIANVNVEGSTPFTRFQKPL